MVAAACAGPIAATLGEELLAAETAADYVTQIESLLADRAHADNIGRAARQRVLASYSWDAHLALIDHYLEETIA
ncbi:MAG: glycosyltransferase [Rhodocyclaceae bacterium]|nr:glycosyltransferase [Rhodocyclaceae bacterium]